MEPKNKPVKKPRRISNVFNREDFEEYKSVMQSESKDGISIYDYYNLDQNDI